MRRVAILVYEDESAQLMYDGPFKDLNIDIERDWIEVRSNPGMVAALAGNVIAAMEAGVSFEDEVEYINGGEVVGVHINVVRETWK